MAGYDHYEEAKWIAESLYAQGFADDSKDIRGALSDGVSGTQVFMHLRKILTPLSNMTELDRFTRDRIMTLIANIDEALAP